MCPVGQASSLSCFPTDDRLEAYPTQGIPRLEVRS